MKRTFKYIFGACLLGLSLAACEEETTTPADLLNITATPGPGEITLNWEVPEEGNIHHIEVRYYDPAQKCNVLKSFSPYNTSYAIEDTRKKYGEYEFRIKTVSPDEGEGNEIVVKATSEAAPSYYIKGDPIQLSELYTNAQESSEGDIANLIDGNLSTYFHSTWSGTVPPGPHYFTAKLAEKMDGEYQFWYSPRNTNSNNKPTDFDLFGSMDGTNWELIKNFTKEADGLPVTSSDQYTSPVMDASGQPFQYIKFSVNKTNNNTIYFTMAEFQIYRPILVDPEAPDEE